VVLVLKGELCLCLGRSLFAFHNLWLVRWLLAASWLRLSCMILRLAQTITKSVKDFQSAHGKHVLTSMLLGKSSCGNISSKLN
jgi:hypothetical protein